MSNLLQITPFLHVPDLAKALDFFQRVLRFEVKYRESNYAFLQREGAPIRILEEPGRKLPASGEKLRITICIDVRDVDALHDELLPELRTLPAGDVHGPMDEPWRQRELHVRLPDGQWLSFTQPVKRGSPGSAGA
jgi:catechol 2,3-dioxygenase-like lactoylglutathione lyase family enzyme